MPAADIVIRGAREHNLQNVSLTLPRNQLIVMTGVSGSGKSSLAFDTLYAEGQRRYVESLSSFARQFLGQLPRPEVDSITGLAPSISIQQKAAGKNPRSTVGTITEIYDYLRVLYARAARPTCYQCGRAITAQTREHIVQSIVQLPAGTRYQLLAPIVQRQKGEFKDLFEDLLKQGFLRARVDGNVVSLSDNLRLDKQMKHTIDVVIDRLVAGQSTRNRVAEAVEQALTLAGGKLIISTEAGAADRTEAPPFAESDAEDAGDLPPPLAASDRLYSSDYACTHCNLSYEPPTPQLFSFNSPQGMCPDCNGLGMRHDFVTSQLLPDESLSIFKGAIVLLGKLSKLGRWRRHLIDGVARAIEKENDLREGLFLKTPWVDLPEAARHQFFYGLGEHNVTFTFKHSGGVWKHGGKYEGFIADLLEEYRKARNPMRRKQLEKYMEFVPCTACAGSRLNVQARHYRLTSRSARNGSVDHVPDAAEPVVKPRSSKRKTTPLTTVVEAPVTSAANVADAPRGRVLGLHEVCALSIAQAAEFFEELELTETEHQIADEVLKEVRGRLGFLLRCGLDYLTLDRTAPTLSGGESQRIRLAGQIGCGLVGVVYILDEPSIGLHPRDNTLLLGSLQDLRDQGNTVIVVEHDDETMLAADHLVDFGPGPGVRGGEIVAFGSVAEVCDAERSQTGAFLSGRRAIELPARRRPVTERELVIHGARHHNLRDVTAHLPLGTFLCITGVSGSGKSSLINDILWQVLNRDVNGGDGAPGQHIRIDGLELVDKAIDIDQSPIGRTPRSNPATYIKLFDLIRDLYTQLPESKLRGFPPGRFSFNVPGGRCEACEGHGATKLEMDFLADVWVTCPVCQGRRFNHETLEIRFKGKTIAEVLDMDVQQALTHFENIPKIRHQLQTLADVGLDYLKLGQASPTLSGGEAQRVKLAKELSKRSTGKTVYILDEPTTGLHFVDIEHLLRVLHGFVEAGNTVIVVEHNLDVIKTADWVLDLGPEGGAGGGQIVCEGTPEDIAACPASYTGLALQPVLERAHARREALAKLVPPTPPVQPMTEAVAVKPKRGKRAKVAEAAPTDLAANKSPITPPLSLPVTSAARRLAASPRWQPQRRNEPDEAHDQIVVRGAAQHNLQQVDLLIPRDKMSVFCGPSGSGKSSLAMDTLYAEGQRRYVESLSSYARQFLGQMPKPRVEHIHGLQPAIAIEQKTVGKTPRSTVGTVTEVYDYLRILYARLGTQFCPACDTPVQSQTTDDVIDKLMSRPAQTRLLVLAPQEVTVGQVYPKLWERLREQGFRRVRVDGTTHVLEEVPEIDRRRKHTVEIVVDRVTIAPGQRSRLAESVQSAFDLGQGLIRIATVQENKAEPQWQVEPFSLFRSCQECGRSFEELAPQNFSFNSPLGWCPTCEGIGTQQGTSLQGLIANPAAPLGIGAIAAWPDPATRPFFAAMLTALGEQFDFPLDVPYSQLSPRQQQLILQGTGDTLVSVRWDQLPQSATGTAPTSQQTGAVSTEKRGKARGKERAKSVNKSVAFQFTYKGLFPAIEEASRVSFSYRQQLFGMSGEIPCAECNGSRLRDDAGHVRLQGKTLQQFCDLPLRDALQFLRALPLTESQQKIAADLLTEATSRLDFLVDVGLHYLTLARTLPTLSGGETQRIRLAGQIGRALTGVLYVLDEPTIGLHPSDNGRLLGALTRLRDLGNTIIMVEHDREVLAAADRLYDFGPGAGRFGGTVTAQGTPGEIRTSKGSLTGQYLSDREQIIVPEQRRMPSGAKPDSSKQVGAPVPIPESAKTTGTAARRTKSPVAEKATTRSGSPDNSAMFLPPGGGWLTLTGARKHNLRNVDLAIPLGTLTAITGVSGSGKSSLIQETLARAVARTLHRAAEQPGPYDELQGIEQLGKLIVVDQQPLGSTPASNPATYCGVFDEIRELYAKLPEAKIRGYRPARFSFNRPGGRCEACEGNGQKLIEMHFLPDVWVECDVCRGQRYNLETLTVRYRGQSIADVLQMSIGEALELFSNIPKIRAPLAVLAAIGLDYLTLGQSAPTLSGGEAQRVKLAAELARPQSGNTLYLLDEPTTGLHFDDIRKLLKILNSLVDAGNSVVVIEHNLDVIKTADWVVDLGPHAGAEGGWIVAAGTPEDVVAQAEQAAKGVPARPGETARRSFTGELLAAVLRDGKRGERESFDPQSVWKKRQGDLDLAKLGREVRMPWESDGRQWHTVSRVANNGQACRWSGDALSWVVDWAEEDDRFAPINWNARSVVEIIGTDKLVGWFMHAYTGEEWLLTLKFRVRKGTFKEADLAGELNLPDLNDLDEIPVYNRAARVRVSTSRPPWQEVTVVVTSLEDVSTPEFAEFLEAAKTSYFQQVAPEGKARSIEDLAPWKQLGRKWHLMSKGFTKGTPEWDHAVLDKLFGVLTEVFPEAKVEWTNKMLVNWRLLESTIGTLRVLTKNPSAIEIQFSVPSGSIPNGKLLKLADDCDVVPEGSGFDRVSLWLTREKQVLSAGLRDVFQEWKRLTLQSVER